MVVVTLAAAAPQEHHGERAQNDLQVLERRLGADVIEVVGELAPHVFHGQVVPLMDLRPARDPGPHPLAALVSLDLLTQRDEDRRLLGAWPTMFMSPRSTLTSCGNSSTRSFRSTRPITVTRSSSGAAHTWRGPFPRSTCIVRNLWIVNGLPPTSIRRRVLPPAPVGARRSSPMRVCRNRDR